MEKISLKIYSSSDLRAKFCILIIAIFIGILNSLLVD